jgi:hypothetical protein
MTIDDHDRDLFHEASTPARTHRRRANQYAFLVCGIVLALFLLAYFGYHPEHAHASAGKRTVTLYACNPVNDVYTGRVLRGPARRVKGCRVVNTVRVRSQVPWSTGPLARVASYNHVATCKNTLRGYSGSDDDVHALGVRTFAKWFVGWEDGGSHGSDGRAFVDGLFQYSYGTISWTGTCSGGDYGPDWF